jgi:hypothetical protein
VVVSTVPKKKGARGAPGGRGKKHFSLNFMECSFASSGGFGGRGLSSNSPTRFCKVSFAICRSWSAPGSRFVWSDIPHVRKTDHNFIIGAPRGRGGDRGYVALQMSSRFKIMLTASKQSRRVWWLSRSAKVKRRLQRQRARVMKVVLYRVAFPCSVPTKMCGIFGCHQYAGGDLGAYRTRALALSKRLRHRGPGL